MLCKSLLSVALLLGGVLSLPSWPSQTRSRNQNGCTKVKTDSGLIVGHPAKGRPEVDEYLGIHYATAERFAEPTRYQSGRTYEALNFANECPANKGSNGTLPGQPYTESEYHIIGDFIEQFNTSQGEDCLALNVWSQQAHNAKKPKPVLLWAYGGRFETGWTAVPFYNGQYLASSEDIVVVTYNYRFGIFGFPGNPAASLNPGLLDSRMALEWVRDNIAGFGGDPTRITFAGHSAGGFVIDYLSYAYPDDPIFSGMILQSGTALTIPSNTPEETYASFKNTSGTLGCTDEDAEALLTCMRSKPWQEILRASRAAPTPYVPGPFDLHAPVEPTIDNKTTFSIAQYNKFAYEGQYARVPVLLGNANYESGFYKIQFSADPAKIAKYQTNETFWSDLNQRLATCPAALASSQRTSITNKQHGVPVWRYRYFGQYSSLELYPANENGTSRGSEAYHGSELTVLWGTSQNVTHEADSQGLQEMSAYLMRAWGAFIRDPQAGLKKELGWPEYDPKGHTLISLGRDGVNAATYTKSTEFDTGCEEVMKAGTV